MKPELSIIIASYKQPELLKLCIGSIQKNTKGVEYEIISVDGETEEATYDVMRENFPEINFIPNHYNVGFAKLVNQGLDVARGEHYLIINADIIIKNDAISKLLEYIKEKPEVGIVGPKLINFDNSIQESCFRFYSPLTVVYRRTFLGKLSFAKKHLERFVSKNNKTAEADWLMGSAMMTSKGAVKNVGPMDEKYFMYFEDVDWCWRFWENDYKVMYHPKVSVFHYHGKASASKSAVKSVLFNKYTRIHIRSAIKFFLKNFGKKNPHDKFKNKHNKK